MKKRNLIRPGGILRWSTAFILAGGVAGLSSCDRPLTEDSQAAVQARVDEPDPVQKQLESGLVENNFHLPKVGYYHAAVRSFHEFPYNQFRDDRYYVNGEWLAEPGPVAVEASRPAPEELKKVEAALEAEQKSMAQNPQSHSGGGFGMGNALMMYWLLSGNRGFFSPGAGFRQASGQAPAWQRSMQDERRRTGYAGGGGSYRTTPSAPDSPSSTRGGFGTRGGSGSSFGG